MAAPTRKRSRSTAGSRPSAPPSAVALRARQLAKAIQHRAQQLEHPGEGDLGLARDAAGPQHREVFGARRGEVQQRGLARARDAPQHQRARRRLLVSRRSATPGARTPASRPRSMRRAYRQPERCRGEM